jgi:disulfide bond formation protein DsbB
MNRSALLAAGLIGVIGTFFAPRFAPTAGFSLVLVFFVCSLGALAGLWIVSYALSLD